MNRARISKRSLRLISELRHSLRLLVPEESDLSRERLIVAVSGGKDSMALLEALLWLRGEGNIDFTVAHFDHRLRAESVLDREFVENEARRRGLRCFSGVAGAKPPGENLEAWARVVRYEYLESVRKSEGASFILTAHHRDDEAETLLFRTLSGRLTTRASGVQRLDRTRRLLRPWLGVSREEIESFVHELSIPFREDKSNQLLDRTRNRLRLETIPILEREYNPSLKSSLAELSERLTQDEEFLWKLARTEAKRLHRTWSLEQFQQTTPAIRWRVLGELAKLQQPGLERDLGYRKLRTLEEHLVGASGEGFELAVGGELRAVYSRGNGLKFVELAAGGPQEVTSTTPMKKVG